MAKRFMMRAVRILGVFHAHKVSASARVEDLSGVGAVVPAEAPTWVENEPWVSRKSLIDGSSALRQALGLGQHLRGTPVDDLAAEPHPVEVTHTE